LEETRRRRICNIIPRALGRGYVQEKDEEGEKLEEEEWYKRNGRGAREGEDWMFFLNKTSVTLSGIIRFFVFPVSNCRHNYFN
jgi:hypothetical protein